MRNTIIALATAFVVTVGAVQPVSAQSTTGAPAPTQLVTAVPGSSDRDIIDVLGIRWVFEQNLIPWLPAPAPAKKATPAPAPAKKAAPAPAPAPAPAKKAAPAPAPKDVYYKNCAAVRAAGKAPLYRGQPGYEAPRLDRDWDGIDCE